MDEYGCLTICREDAQAIRNVLSLESNLVPYFSLHSSPGTAMNILITNSIITVGVPSWGGRPRDRVFVSVPGHGAFHFAREKTDWKYFAEKLHLPVPDAQGLARFWELIWEGE